LDANARAKRAIERVAVRFASNFTAAPRFVSLDQPRWAFPLASLHDGTHCILNHYESPSERTYLPSCLYRARMIADIFAATVHEAVAL